VERGDTITTRNSGLHGTCAITSITPYNGPMVTRPQANHNQFDSTPDQKTY
jgi:hypothetical protein